MARAERARKAAEKRSKELQEQVARLDAANAELQAQVLAARVAAAEAKAEAEAARTRIELERTMPPVRDAPKESLAPMGEQGGKGSQFAKYQKKVAAMEKEIAQLRQQLTEQRPPLGNLTMT